MTSYVYFMRPAGMLGPIKIGCSIVPKRRLVDLASWSPFQLELIHTFPAEMQIEAKIHRRFACALSHREWFHATPDLLQFIERLIAGEKLEDIIDLTLTAKRLRPGYTAAHRVRQSWYTKINFAARRRGDFSPPTSMYEFMRRWSNDITAVPTPEEFGRMRAYSAPLNRVAAA